MIIFVCYYDCNDKELEKMIENMIGGVITHRWSLKKTYGLPNETFVGQIFCPILMTFKVSLLRFLVTN